MKLNDLWQAALAELQLNLSTANFSAWFSNTKIINLKKVDNNRNLIEIAVANPYVKNTIESRYQGQIQEILNRLLKTRNDLLFTVKDLNVNGFKKDPGPLFKIDFEKEKHSLLEKAIKKSRLRLDYTFENFAVSSTNEMAHAAAIAVANSPGKTYHLFFLYGGVGVGKTHLTQAVGHEILKKDPYARVVYCTSEEFTNEIVEAIKSKTTKAFREKYRQAKALLIDDIQFIGGKEAIQEEFFHTFNTIHTFGGQIVLTSDRLPHEIEGLEARLRSRFEGGLTIDVQEPSFELRTAILLIKARQRKKALPIDVAKLIANYIKSTRQLEGFLIRLFTEAETKNELITPGMCQRLLKGIIGRPVEATISFKPQQILKAVADYYKVSPVDLKGPRRQKLIVFPRQVAMYLIKKELKKEPLISMGMLFGNRDHTTVMHSIEKIEKLVTISEDLRLDLEAIKKRMLT